MALEFEYLFRVNGSHDLGLGHIYRTKALAEVITENNEKCVFVINEDIKSKSILKGFKVIELDPENNLTKEIEKIDCLVKNYSINLIINDLFDYPIEYCRFLKNQESKIVSFHEHQISDSFSDLVINYNTFPGAFNSDSLDYDSCLGPSYCIFPKSLRKLEKTKKKGNKIKILLSFGGSDPSKYTTKVLEYLIKTKHQMVAIDQIVVHLGPSNNQIEYIKKLIKRSNLEITIKSNVKNLHTLLSECDLAFASGGNTMYELCCLGIPTLIFPQNQHQENFSLELNKRKIIKLIKREMIGNESFIITAINKVLSDRDERERMSSVAKQAFNKNGVDKVYMKIKQLLK
ncbi:hypothetical protein N9425_02645 [Gammaproteobacteria bacterium]|nr:hypothetical protein [Gammaproteobacteria bacterium]